MKNVLFLLMGKHNIESWDDNEIQDISLDEVKRIEFTDEQSRQTTIAILEQFALEDYIILDEDEYNFLIN